MSLLNENQELGKYLCNICGETYKHSTYCISCYLEKIKNIILCSNCWASSEDCIMSRCDDCSKSICPLCAIYSNERYTCRSCERSPNHDTIKIFMKLKLQKEIRSEFNLVARSSSLPSPTTSFDKPKLKRKILL